MSKPSYEYQQIETITNENGTAIKYPDGTMICIGSFLHKCQINSALGNGFYKNSNIVQYFACPFVGERPIINVTSVSEWCIIASTRANVNAIIGLTLYNIMPGSTELDYYFDYIAIGRWK